MVLQNVCSDRLSLVEVHILPRTCLIEKGQRLPCGPKYICTTIYNAAILFVTEEQQKNDNSTYMPKTAKITTSTSP